MYSNKISEIRFSDALLATEVTYICFNEVSRIWKHQNGLCILRFYKHPNFPINLFWSIAFAPHNNSVIKHSKRQWKQSDSSTWAVYQRAENVFLQLSYIRLNRYFQERYFLWESHIILYFPVHHFNFSLDSKTAFMIDSNSDYQLLHFYSRRNTFSLNLFYDVPPLCDI